jgi:hypothetical protein
MSTIETGRPGQDPPAFALVETASPVPQPIADANVRVLTDGQRNLAAEDRQLHAQRRARSWHRRAAHWMGKRVRHPDGGAHTVESTLQDEKDQRVAISTDRSNGSKRHDRLPGWICQVPKLVMGCDLGLLLFFFSGVTDVDWARPSLSAALLFAIMLALAVTVLAYGLFAFAGNRLRSFRTHAGQVHLTDLDGFTKVIAAGSAVGIIVLATLMFVRMDNEVAGALGPGSGTTALLVALALAVVSALANFLVIAIHAHNGSYEVDRLDKLSAATRRAYARAHRARGKAAKHLDT